MKTLFNTIDDIMGLVPWFIAAWCLFGFATMAQAQDLTLGQRIVALCYTGTYQVQALAQQCKRRLLSEKPV
jgi:hypothetical protein